MTPPQLRDKSLYRGLKDRDRILVDLSMQTFLDNILSPMSEAESRRLWDRFGKEVPW